MLHPPEAGPYRFRCTDKDDRATIWLDLDRDGLFELTGSAGTEKLGGNENFTSDWVQLDPAGGPYKIAIAHGEWGGGSRLRPWIMIPNDDVWHIIDPSDPTQAGFWRIPFNSSISANLSAYSFFKHGGVSSLDLQSGNFGFTHPLENGSVTGTSGITLLNKTWYHLHKQVDQENGLAQLFVDGSLEVTQPYDANLAIEDEISSEWIIGSGTIASTVDEVRISDQFRNPDWVLASYSNQKDNPTFPTTPTPLQGAPSFTTANRFTLYAEQPFSHIVEATGSPIAYVGTGLPSGLILQPADGNLSGSPTTAGIFEPNLRAVYSDGAEAFQSYQIEVLAGPPELTIFPPQSNGASSLQVPFEVLATGGDNPNIWVLADTVDQGKDFYKWQYRFDLGPQGLGTSSTTIGGLAPDRSYYIRLYASNSAGDDWTGKEFSIRTQPDRSQLPFGLGIWFDATDISGTGNPMSQGMNVITWVDKSSYGRNMNIVYGDPSIAMDGYEGRPVVDFDGNDQLISTYDFRGSDLGAWRNGGYTAFGVSRYTGKGRNNRVISSRGQNWFIGHHGNRNARFFMNGWVHQGNAADTDFHIWEIKQEGRSHNGNPFSTVYADGIELANNQNSNNWNHFPGQLSFGAWADLSEASNCQVAEFLIFQGLMADNDRFLVEGYLSHKWGIDLPSNHPWVREKPTFGDEIISGSTSVGVTTQSQTPIVRNREPANLTTNSAVLTGQLVDAGLGMIPSDPDNAIFSPLDYPGLRLWLDVSDADGDGLTGSSYDDANVSPPTSWHPGVLSPALWLDASELTSADSTWHDKGPAGNDATRHGSPNVIPAFQNGLSVMRYSGMNGEYHSFANLSNIRTVFWVWKNSGGNYFMLGDDNQHHFHKGSLMFDSGWTSPNISNAFLKLNGSVVPVTGTGFPADLSILTLRTSGNVEASSFSNDRNIGGRYANGDLGELLIYTVPLSDEEIDKVEGYLAHKWALDSDLPDGHSYKASFNESYAHGIPLHILKDKSGQTNDATQDENASQPEFVKNALGNKPVLRFDGADDYLEFEEVNQIRTLFAVVNRNPGNQGFILGHPVAHCFHSGVNTVWSETWTDTYVLNGLLRINGNEMDGISTNYPSSEPVIFALRTDGMVRATNFSKDRNNNRYWNGEMAEILVYNEPLPSSIMRKVEGYLAHKWGTVATLVNSHPYKNFTPIRSTPSAQAKIYWGGTDGGENPSLWENEINIGEVYVGLRKLENEVTVLAAPKPNNAGGTYSEQKLIDLQLPMDGWMALHLDCVV